jgi:Uma2 family endonuclease
MGRTRPNRADGLTRYRYEEAALLAMRNQSLEEIMEATPQATQRKITLASLDLVRAHRPDFQVFNELLVQYPGADAAAIERVVPDNMVVLHDEDLGPLASFNLPLLSARPFWVMEYVSPSSKRKDYDESFRKYERDLKVPYYLIFYPDNDELTLYRLNERRGRYDTVLPDAEGRCALPEVGIEVGLVDGWTRFWLQGRLLPLPAELDRELQETRAELVRERQRADDEKLRADEAASRADRLAAQLRALGIDPEA